MVFQGGCLSIIYVHEHMMIHDGHDGNLFGSMHGAGGLQLEMEFVARPDPAGGMPGGPGGFHYQFSGEAWFAVTHTCYSLALAGFVHHS